MTNMMTENFAYHVCDTCVFCVSFLWYLKFGVLSTWCCKFRPCHVQVVTDFPNAQNIQISFLCCCKLPLLTQHRIVLNVSTAWFPTVLYYGVMEFLASQAMATPILPVFPCCLVPNLPGPTAVVPLDASNAFVRHLHVWCFGEAGFQIISLLSKPYFHAEWFTDVTSHIMVLRIGFWSLMKSSGLVVFPLKVQKPKKKTGHALLHHSDMVPWHHPHSVWAPRWCCPRMSNAKGIQSLSTSACANPLCKQWLSPVFCALHSSQSGPWWNW